MTLVCRPRSMSSLLLLLWALILASALPVIHGSTAEVQLYPPDEDDYETLPIWATQREQDQYHYNDKDGDRTLRRRPILPTNPTPLPSTTRRFPAEWEAVDQILIGYIPWASLNVRRVLQDIAQAVTDAGVPVYAAQGPKEGLVQDEALYSNAPAATVNTIWIRDYGPVTVLESNTSAHGTTVHRIVDFTYRLGNYRPADDSMPCMLETQCQSNSLVMDGGNLMTDGQGNLFMTQVTYHWNAGMERDQVDDVLKQLLGVDTIHALPYAILPGTDHEPLDGTGHIDMFVKLLDTCTVVISQTNDPVFAETMEAAAAYFETLYCRAGRRKRRYTIVRLPAWVIDTTQYPYWVTYSNSLLIEDHTILVPSFRDGPNDEVQALYQQAAPGRNIVMIDSDAVIRLGGAVHCVTQQVPALDL